ncbi:MAG: ABC transporter ATP-binding protein [Magnetococcales bacterium]|nr:ABC transporter ATP-binding protein [Magnetococcales bacterium]
MISEKEVNRVTEKPAALAIAGLDKAYGQDTYALRDVSLTIEPGSFHAILGPNGAGKSTLINIVAQTVKKSRGRVTVFGVDIDQEPVRAKSLLGVTPQELSLDVFFTVREVLNNHSGYYGVRDNTDWVDALIQRLGLGPHADKPARALSGGMKRRLTIGKALVHKPKLLILDEPTAGVDVELRHSLWNFVRELHAEGTTVILTTHYLEEAEELAEKITILREGVVIADAPTEALLQEFGTRRFDILLQEGKQWNPCPQLEVEVVQEGRVRGRFEAEENRLFFECLSRNADIIADLQVERPRLEEVFLKLTGNTVNSSGASKGEGS